MKRSAVRGIRHAQQRFGQHHQRKALLGGQRELAQHVLDAAEPVVSARMASISRVAVRSMRAFCSADSCGLEQPGGDRAIVGRIGRAERRTGGDGLAWRFPRSG